MSIRGENNQDGSYNWTGAIIDSVIISGVTFFSTLGAGSVTGVPTKAAIIGAAIAAATQFFITLAIKRGLRKPEE